MTKILNEIDGLLDNHRLKQEVSLQHEETQNLADLEISSNTYELAYNSCLMNTLRLPKNSGEFYGKGIHVSSQTIDVNEGFYSLYLYSDIIQCGW